MSPTCYLYVLSVCLPLYPAQISDLRAGIQEEPQQEPCSSAWPTYRSSVSRQASSAWQLAVPPAGRSAGRPRILPSGNPLSPAGRVPVLALFGVGHSRERDRFTVRPTTHSLTVHRPPFLLHRVCRTLGGRGVVIISVRCIVRSLLLKTVRRLRLVSKHPHLTPWELWKCSLWKSKTVQAGKIGHAGLLSFK